jgi:hypothetical protein
MVNCTNGYHVNLTTTAPLTDEEITQAEWIADYGWIVAVSLALAGCVVNNLGSNIQKLAFRFAGSAPAVLAAAAEQSDGVGKEHVADAAATSERKEILASAKTPKCVSVWAAGFVLQILGASLDMVALGYGDQSLVAPIGALALVANIGFARCLHKEELSCLDGLFMFVILVGCVVCTVSAGKHSCPSTRADIWQRFVSWELFWGYAIAITAVMVVLGTLQGVAERLEKKFGRGSKEYGRLAKIHRVGYPIMGGVIGAQGVLLGNAGVTCVTEMVSGAGGPWAGWEIFLFVFFAGVCLTFVMLQVVFLNKGLQRWDAMLEVPVMQSTWIVFCILGGGVFFEEFLSFKLWQYFVFPLGACITLAGVGLLAYYRRHKRKDRRVKPDPDGAAAGLGGADANAKDVDGGGGAGAGNSSDQGDDDTEAGRGETKTAPAHSNGGGSSSMATWRRNVEGADIKKGGRRKTTVALSDSSTPTTSGGTETNKSHHHHHHHHHHRHHHNHHHNHKNKTMKSSDAEKNDAVVAGVRVRGGEPGEEEVTEVTEEDEEEEEEEEQYRR